jgi:hypothetical protein
MGSGPAPAVNRLVNGLVDRPTDASVRGPLMGWRELRLGTSATMVQDGFLTFAQIAGAGHMAYGVCALTRITPFWHRRSHRRVQCPLARSVCLSVTAAGGAVLNAAI